MVGVLRPRAALLTGVVLSIVLVVAAIVGWMLLPEGTRVLFTGVQLATLGFFVAVLVAVMLGVGLSSVRTSNEGLVIRNGLRRHTVPWAQVRGFRLTADDPWAYVLLKDEPDTRPLLAVQRVDGRYATEAVARLKKEWTNQLRRAPE